MRCVATATLTHSTHSVPETLLPTVGAVWFWQTWCPQEHPITAGLLHPTTLQII